MASLDKNTYNILREEFIQSSNVISKEITSTNNINDSNDITLSKTIYGKNNAKKILDEEFSEFIQETKNYKEFFELYDSFFYDIPKSIHESFKNESIHYLDYNFLGKNEQILQGLEDQLENIQEQIDSIERHHPIFKNGSVIARRSDENQTGYDKWLLQSGRKRHIINNEIYNVIKNRLKTDKEDSEFIIFIPSNGLNKILDGPPILNTNGIFEKNEIINTY